MSFNYVLAACAQTGPILDNDEGPIKHHYQYDWGAR